MKLTKQALAIFNSCLTDYHLLDDVDANSKNTFPKKSVEFLLYEKNWVDNIQWHLEDLIRNPHIDPTNALTIKKRIDKLNQLRTDIVEELDELLVESYNHIEIKSTAKLNTESIGWVLDRLSILSLKIYHMHIEAHRENTNNEIAVSKLKILIQQNEDLCIAINQLIEDIEQGIRITKIYKQMKMYNDPQLNPVLYKKNT